MAMRVGTNPRLDLPLKRGFCRDRFDGLLLGRRGSTDLLCADGMLSAINARCPADGGKSNPSACVGSVRCVNLASNNRSSSNRDCATV
eukprot:CAMPEP_0175959616 /NCGR_PEP_ID=MMETSP0108-20121206/34896_1 /TAXON_ID=195067 ORGANISM="Goniomonas pacifica, Strain CCMP1869" /NCGR_SAMPLE_ID=MMETSP0108 /ASSEMBLY_ACC=CAM_ASM_000204 /LENGTH=87 /DNA_ID=CAMNT_0017287089 /DNA_START=337 /DNA_END=601 /DNA_ORIENTATION=+